MKFQKIVFLLGSAFPTPKAYGITTRETINVLIRDSFNVRVFCYKSYYTDPDFNSILPLITYYKLGHISKCLRKIALAGVSKFNSILFRLVSLVVLLNNISQLKHFKPEVIWTREPLYAFICLIRMKDIKVVLEVHEISNFLSFRILNKFLDRILFCPINEPTLNFLQKKIFENFNFEISPMGINANSVASRNEVKNFVNRVKNLQLNSLKIAYVGKLRPTTYSKGIEDLILLASFLQDSKSYMEVNLVGAMKADDEFIRQLTTTHSINKSYLKIHAHVPHSIAVESLKRFDVLVLPSYADSNYIGMPLKLLEYLASGRIVIFGESQLYKDMIPDNIKIFSYSPGDVNDLYKSILDALNHEQLENLIISGIEFAETLTWENRTRKIISRAH